MSSNHLKYDTCAYATTIKESTEPLEYWLYKGKYETCSSCKNGDFTNNIDFSSRADVENELFGLTRLGTDCPSLKYDPTKPFNNPMFSPPIMCQNIYGLTPSNLINPISNMLNENNLGTNSCTIKPNIEHFGSCSPSRGNKDCTTAAKPLCSNRKCVECITNNDYGTSSNPLPYCVDNSCVANPV